MLKKEQHHNRVLMLVEGKCPVIYAVMHSNKTLDVHFQLKYHIHNHKYGYYISKDVLYFGAVMSKMQVAIRHSA